VDILIKPSASALLALLLAAPAGAEWTKKTYATDYDQCTPACYKNNPKAHDKCDNYCHCVTNDIQTRFPDHDQFVREVVEQKKMDHLTALQKIANGCNRQIWGSPARKLKIQ
jgi:hypothetical protein